MIVATTGLMIVAIDTPRSSPMIRCGWGYGSFLERLQRPDVLFVDARGSEEAVYEEVRRQVLGPAA